MVALVRHVMGLVAQFIVVFFVLFTGLFDLVEEGAELVLDDFEELALLFLGEVVSEAEVVDHFLFVVAFVDEDLCEVVGAEVHF